MHSLHPSGALAFVQALQATPEMSQVFNPWAQFDPVNDADAASPARRREHLLAYLEKRLGRAKVVLVGEAPGYQGCKFSGIAMTSERILMDRHPRIRKAQVFDAPAARTSSSAVYPDGAMEPTASIAWGLMLECGVACDEFVFWNAFPFHPHKPAQSLTNRAPTLSELQSTRALLVQFLELFPSAQVVAVGRVAQKVLASQGLPVPHVRHPAMGGATAFRTQMRDLLASPGARS